MNEAEELCDLQSPLIQTPSENSIRIGGPFIPSAGHRIVASTTLNNNSGGLVMMKIFSINLTEVNAESGWLLKFLSESIAGPAEIKL